MTLILSPIPQILFYKNESSRTKLPVALVFYTKLLVRVQTKIILLCQGQFLIGE